MGYVCSKSSTDFGDLLGGLSLSSEQQLPANTANHK